MNRLIVLLGFFFLFYSQPSQAGKLPPLLDQLKTLVEINSGSANVDGVTKIQKWLAQELRDLGFQVEVGQDRLLVGTLKGREEKTISLLMHADTVFEVNSPFQHFKLSDDGKVAIGPGVIDNKGGMIVALEGLKQFLAKAKPRFSIRVISSPSEEIGSPGLLEKFKSFGLDSWLVLGFEPVLDDGSPIESRRGNRWYHIVSEGKEAHAGRAHRDGINACHALGDKLAQISKLTNYKKDVTVSVGWMSGGQDKYNIVCGHAEAKVDTRFARLSDRDDLHRQIDRILRKPHASGAKTSYELADDSPSFSPSKATKPIISKYLSILGSVEGKNIIAQSSGGSADSNYFSREGLLIIDGLGPFGGKMHTSDEYMMPSENYRKKYNLCRLFSNFTIF